MSRRAEKEEPEVSREAKARMYLATTLGLPEQTAMEVVRTLYPTNEYSSLEHWLGRSLSWSGNTGLFYGPASGWCLPGMDRLNPTDGLRTLTTQDVKNLYQLLTGRPL